MMKIDAKNKIDNENDWNVDKTTTNAKKRDKIKSYQNDVRIEKNKMIKSSSQKIKTMKWYWSNERRWKRRKKRRRRESNRCFDKLLEMNCRRRDATDRNVAND